MGASESGSETPPYFEHLIPHPPAIRGHLSVVAEAISRSCIKQILPLGGSISVPNFPEDFSWIATLPRGWMQIDVDQAECVEAPHSIARPADTKKGPTLSSRALSRLS